MIKVFYDGLGCIFTANDLRLLDDERELRRFLQRNTEKQSGNFLLPENVENRFNVIGDAFVKYLCFDDDSDKRMYLIWGNQSLSKIDIFNKAELKTFRANDSENALKLLIDDSNSKTETPEYLNEKHEMHSPELAAAIETWESVLKCNPQKPKTGSRKALIENHIKEKYKFNPTQIERITTMINPDKTGGAPKTE